jgi:NtrC-family two-component system response regulator AlgB
VVITAHASYETAVDAIRRGARDYLPKPFTPAQVRRLLETLAAERRTRARLAELEERVREAVPEAELETRSPAMRAVLDVAFRAAAADAAVLIRGETGTGKSVLARAMHARSPRAAGPFVTVNGAALIGELLASELFGHVKGAFTGAVRDQPGKVDAARGGTLFLDEVGEVDPGVQAKLLRLLAEREYERVGDPAPRRADVRFLAATNVDLAARVREGRFREDLLYRLNVVQVRVPPLRERPEDVPVLARHFLERCAERFGTGPIEVPGDLDERLLAHGWPGNVRELDNVIERLLVLGPSDGPIGPEYLPQEVVDGLTPVAAHVRDEVRSGHKSLSDAVDEFERDLIGEALSRTHFNQTRAATVLGTTRRILKYRMDKLGIADDEYDGGDSPTQTATVPLGQAR